jgi:hypothetical protein
VIHLVKTDSWELTTTYGEYTRTIPAMFKNFDSPAKAWERRCARGKRAMRASALRALAAVRYGRVRKLEDRRTRNSGTFRRGRRAWSATS